MAAIESESVALEREKVFLKNSFFQGLDMQGFLAGKVLGFWGLIAKL